MNKVAKASSAPADPLATSSSAAYSTLHRLAGATGESPLLYQAPAACDAWELLAMPMLTILYLVSSRGKPRGAVAN